MKRTRIPADFGSNIKRVEARAMAGELISQPRTQHRQSLAITQCVQRLV